MSTNDTRAGEPDPAVVADAIAGGRPATNSAEKRHIVRGLHEQRWSDARIAAHTGMNVKTVLRIRSELGLRAYTMAEVEQQTSEMRAAAGRTVLDDEPCVLVRVDLRPSTFRAYEAAARQRGTSVAALLSKAADRAVSAATDPQPHPAAAPRQAPAAEIVTRTRRVMTEADLQTLRELHAKGLRDFQIAHAMGRNPATILHSRRRLGLQPNTAPKQEAS